MNISTRQKIKNEIAQAEQAISNLINAYCRVESLPDLRLEAILENGGLTREQRKDIHSLIRLKNSW